MLNFKENKTFFFSQNVRYLKLAKLFFSFFSFLQLFHFYMKTFFHSINTFESQINLVLRKKSEKVEIIKLQENRIVNVWKYGEWQRLWPKIYIDMKFLFKLLSKFFTGIYFMKLHRDKRMARKIHWTHSVTQSVCHGFRLAKQDCYFWVMFHHFWSNFHFWGSWSSIKNWLKSKTKLEFFSAKYFANILLH